MAKSKTEALRDEYRRLRDGSGLDVGSFDAGCRERIKALSLPLEPQSWIDAATWLIAERKRAAEPAVPEPTSATEAAKRRLPIKQSLLTYYSVSVEGDITRRLLDSDTTREERGAATDEKRLRTTEITVRNIEEHAAATALANQCRGELRRLGNYFSTGVLLVPVDRSEELDAAIVKIAAWCRSHNLKAKNHTVLATVVPCAVLASREDAVAARLTYDIQTLLGQMREALDSCDVERIRQLATEAKLRAAPLQPGLAQGALLAAVEGARAAASRIRAELGDKADVAQQVIAETVRKLDTSAVDSARMMFLEFDSPIATAAPAPDAEAAQRMAALE
jgi:hypothetical protein